MKSVLLFVLLSVGLQNKCSRDAKPAFDDNVETLKKLYATYRNGEIEACRYNSTLVYKAGLNAYDAGSVVFDVNGNKIGSCNYGWGKPDSMCEKLSECRDVYRIQDNIWDKPAADLYNLAR
jgi:hypothetical protein